MSEFSKKVKMDYNSYKLQLNYYFNIILNKFRGKMIVPCLISSGVLILCYSLLANIKIYKNISENKFKRRYQFNLFLIVFFIVLYLLFGILNYQKTQTNQLYLVSAILFMGSIFVLLMTKTAGRLIHQLNDININLEKKITEKSSELIKAQKVLETKVLELENTQEQLSQASKMSALGEMAGQIAHEINTPLGAITLTTQTLRKINEGTSDETQKGAIEKNIEHILKITKQISKIINSLKRVYSGKETKIIKSVLVSDLIEDVVWLFSEKVRRVGVDFVVVNTLDENEKLNCRVSEIVQVLNNLLNNAYDVVKNQKEKKISLKISYVDQDVEFRVEDNGGGVPDEIRDKIFQSQFTTKESGLGIGLGISLRIAKDHQGVLYLDKNTDNTVFVFRLPIIQRNQIKTNGVG